jgi:tripartite-type tricarboxylate transporter receptor subunit TctC
MRGCHSASATFGAHSRARREACAAFRHARRFLDLGLEPRPSTPAELGELMASEVARWSRVIAEAGIEKQ